MLLISSPGLAQNTLTLVQALSQRGPTLQSAQATLQLNALKADPSTLVVARTQAEHNARLAEVNLEATRLSVMQSVWPCLDVAKARQAAGNATALDVARAQTTLDSSRQSSPSFRCWPPSSPPCWA
jgi:outer membrane protein TolC